MKIIFSICLVFFVGTCAWAKTESQQETVHALNQKLQVLDHEMKALLKTLQAVGDQEHTPREKRDAGLFQNVQFPAGPVPKVSTLSNRGKFYELNHMRKHRKADPETLNLAAQMMGNTAVGRAMQSMGITSGAAAGAGAKAGTGAGAFGQAGQGAIAGQGASRQGAFAGQATRQGAMAGAGAKAGAFGQVGQGAAVAGQGASRQGAMAGAGQATRQGGMTNGGQGAFGNAMQGAAAKAGKNPSARADGKVNARSRLGARGKGKQGKLMSKMPAVRRSRPQQ